MADAVVELTANIWGQLRNAVNLDVWDLVGRGAPVDGTSGTAANLAGRGSTYTDITNDDGIFFLQTSDKASPIWIAFSALVPASDSIATAMIQDGAVTENKILDAAVTERKLSVSNANGLFAMRVGIAQYNFATDGGAQGLITPDLNCLLPARAIIMGGIIDVLTTFDSGGAATVAVGTSAGSAANSLKLATGFASYTGKVATVPVFTAASAVKLTAAGAITLTVAAADLIAGVANIVVFYTEVPQAL